MAASGLRVRIKRTGILIVGIASLGAFLLVAAPAGLESGAAARDDPVSPTPESYAHLPAVVRSFNPAWAPTPTAAPTATATASPTATPTATPTGTPTATPSATPTAPSSTPTATPTPTITPGTGCSTAPTLMGPASGSTVDTLIPLLQWDSGNNPNATAVELEIWLDPELTEWAYGLRSAYQAQGTHEWRLNLNLEPATTHYWRAYLMCGSTQGPYSAVWSFTTGSGGTILPAPNLLSPADGSTLPGTAATVQWSSVSGAVEYWLWYSGGGWDRGRPTADTHAALSLDPNTTYEWWVQARNDYALGNESTHWEFTTGAGESSISISPSSEDRIVVQRDGSTTVFEEHDTR